jgi:phosphatidylglycerol:prolipoprotein diacylglycerol transferase
MFVCGILGARIFYVVEYWSQMRARLETPSLLSLLGMLVNYTRGGLVVYGALAGAAVAFLAFCWRRKLPTLAVADLIAPSLALGQGLGRLGCFLSGCCFGGACDLPWAVTFPWATAPHVHQVRTAQTDLHGLWLDFSLSEPTLAKVEPDSAAARAGLSSGDRLIAVDGQTVASTEQALAMLLSTPPGEELSVVVAGKPAVSWTAAEPLPRSRPVHPAQLYSAFDALLLCGLLLAYYPYRRRDGEVIALGLTLHAITRYLLEVIRIDEPAVFGTGLSISQTISVGMLVALAAGWLWLLTRPRGTALPAAV